MKGLDAIHSLSEGKKLTCTGGTVCFTPGTYIHMVNRKIIDNDGKDFDWRLDTFLNLEWEIYEEPEEAPGLCPLCKSYDIYTSDASVMKYDTIYSLIHCNNCTIQMAQRVDNDEVKKARVELIKRWNNTRAAS